MKTLLFSPFEKYAEKTLFLVGFILTLTGSFVAYIFNIRFDGIFDVHIVSTPFFYQTLIDNLINIFCLTLFLYLSAKYINKKTRFIDVLTTSMIARIPLYLIPLININNVIGKSTENIEQLINPESLHQIPSSSIVIIIVFAIVTILFLIWSISLLFNGFKVASNAKGKTPIILFILSLLLSEVLSKFLIFQLN